MGRAEVLLIGGRAGVGKTTLGWEVAARLRAAAVSHAIIEGDFMGQVYPAPEGDPHRSEIVERNLTAVWAPMRTDARPVVDIAREVAAATGWAGQRSARES